jgi:hypothetical protein
MALQLQGMTEWVGQLWGEVWDWAVNINWQWVAQLCGEVCDRVVNTNWRSEWKVCGVRFEIGLWIQIDRVCGAAVDCVLRLGCEYKLTEWVGQLCGEVRDWAVNTDWRSDWDSCGVRFETGLRIQNDRVSGIAVGWGVRLGCQYRLTEWVGKLCGEVWDWAENTNWRSEWDRCGVRFQIGLWIQTDGVSRTAMDGCLRLGREYRLTEWVGQLWGEVCDGVVNTDWRSEWESCGWSFEFGPWIQTDGVGQLCGEVCDWVVNTDGRNEWGSCGWRFEIRPWIQTEGVSGTTVGWVLWWGCKYRLTEWDSCVVSFVIGLWIKTDGVSGTAVGWGLWLGCEYRLMEWVGQLWGEVWDWTVNTNWWRQTKMIRW